MYAAVRDITNVHPLRDEVAKAGVKDKVRIIEIDVTSDESVKAGVAQVRAS